VADYSAHFSRFLSAVPGRLHAAAHSHHPWPDVTYDAQVRAWEDAAGLMDAKWDRILTDVVPEAQRHIAGRLGLSDPAAIAFAPNTHSLLLRILSCLPDNPRVLTTDAEFHSFTRQLGRLEEEGRVSVERVPAEPFASFPDRFAAAAAAGGHDLVFFSHVHFNSGYVTPDPGALAEAVAGAGTYVVVDGYHGFMAVPSDLSAIESRAFYLAGGYKYAMAGEGACFLHCPPGWCPRPRDTGWYAGFGALSDAPDDVAGYGTDGSRFLGATFDPTGLYRFNAVQRWLDSLGVTVEAIHEHVANLQRVLLDRLDPRLRAALVPGEGLGDRGHFLTFRLPDAERLHEHLASAGILTDRRGDRLRIGLGLYHNEDDARQLARRLGAAS
jgi:selenocysteine lyase/cysteine desulfurase